MFLTKKGKTQPQQNKTGNIKIVDRDGLRT